MCKSKNFGITYALLRIPSHGSTITGFQCSYQWCVIQMLTFLNYIYSETEVPKACRMDPDEGPCRGFLKRYAYNMQTMKCEQFYYGGCYGNDNNFKDKASCMDFCSPRRDAPSFCYSPKDEGSCSASVTRYYFNIESKACEEFVYTGCGGNSNNFVKMEDCDSVCKKGSKRPRNRNRIRVPRIQS
ncbi:hypothetical protein XENTR_v10016024 [Xenopus tropicalis]|nr:hypothetical protein XENTR_v10016024 [Xenopus tropicalis]